MRVRWDVDAVANAILWRDLDAIPLRLVDGPGEWVADLGGGNGNFVSPLRRRGARLATVDIDRRALRQAGPLIRPILGSLTRLPLRDASLHAAAGRAVLHHVPEELDAAVRESRRIVRPGGLVLFQEPTSGNWLANAARKRFPTERHDPHERPLPGERYVETIRRHFDVVETRHEFLLSYLLPHLVARLPPDRRNLARALTRAVFGLDRRLLAALPGLRPRAAYVSVLARRPP